MTLLSILILIIISLALIEYYISIPRTTPITYKLEDMDYRIIDLCGTCDERNFPTRIDIYVKDLKHKSFDELVKFLKLFYANPDVFTIGELIYDRYIDTFDGKKTLLSATQNKLGFEFCLHDINYRESHVTSGTCTRFIRMKNTRGMVCFKEYSDNPRDTCLALLSPSKY